jgi:hypothetical protein
MKQMSFKRINFVLLAALMLAMAGAQAFYHRFGLACVGVAVSVALFVLHVFRAKHFEKIDREEQ